MPAALVTSGAATRAVAQPVRIPSHARPLHIERVGLRVQNLTAMTMFYEQVIGLKVQKQGARGAILGAGGVGLIELELKTDAKPAAPQAAGLYHVAFVMPTRVDLARWILHAARHHFQVTGVANHLVSESIYLNDPEGNGVEVYAERPEETWDWTSGQVAMGVHDLDLDDILRLVDAEKDRYPGAPDAMRIGHIHLKVGELEAAEQFYTKLIGLNVTRRAPGVIFMSSGKYHHHVATNVWESQGSGARDLNSLGMAWYAIAVSDAKVLAQIEARLSDARIPTQRIDGTLRVSDPWRNELRLAAK